MGGDVIDVITVINNGRGGSRRREGAGVSEGCLNWDLFDSMIHMMVGVEGWMGLSGLLGVIGRLVVHLRERWREMTVYPRQPGVFGNANRLEGKLGRMRPRYRTPQG